MSPPRTPWIVGVAVFCGHSIVQWLSWASHSGQAALNYLAWKEQTNALEGSWNWDVVWRITSLPTFALVPERLLTGSFEIWLLANSSAWALVAGWLAYYLTPRASRALIIAAGLEVLMLTYLVRSLDRGNENLIVQAVGTYHIPGGLVSYLVLLYWDPGPRPGPTAASNAVYLLTMFGVQMLITTPVVYLVLRWVGRHRARRTQP